MLILLNFLEKYGPPGEIRTPDTQVRSLVLYPAELRAEDAKLRFTGGKGQGIACIAGTSLNTLQAQLKVLL